MAGDDDDGTDVTGHAERPRRGGEREEACRQPGQPDTGHPLGAEPIHEPPGRHTHQRSHQRTDRGHHPDPRGIEPERTGEVERPDDERGHHHRRHERAPDEAGAQDRIAQPRQANQGRSHTRLDEHEEAEPGQGHPEQRTVAWAEAPTPRRQREGVERECQHQHERAERIEGRPAGPGRPRPDREGPERESQVEDPQRHVDEEDRPPAGEGDQDPSERGAERRTDRRHRPQQPHGATGPRLRHRLTGQRDGECHHDRRADALDRARRDEQPEGRRDAAEQRCHGEHGDPDQEQLPATDEVAEPSRADDQGGDRQEIGQDDPLDFLEGGIEGLRHCRQPDVGNAGVERRHHHGEGKRGQRPARRRCAFHTALCTARAGMAEDASSAAHTCI